jgi:histidyl-tRNA synthetase
MTKIISIPRGTADILPEEMLLWQEIGKRARTILECYNYKEIRTPVFEQTDLFKRSLGSTSDVVNKQLLELASDKKEGFSLRPEGTAPVVRCYIENNIGRQESISKLFYIGPMFRGERPQKGRLRQFHQIGVEVIGADTANPYLDAEVVALNVHLLKALGLQGFQLKLNTLGSLEDKENFSRFLRGALKTGLGKLCGDCQNRFERNVFRVLDCKNEKCRDVVGGIDIGHAHLSSESRKYFDHVKEALTSLGVKFDIVPTLVRGLDYYTHTVFEISGQSLGSQDALSAGGRYNNLVSQLGGAQADAVGFALGIERLLLAMPPDQKPPQKGLDVFIIALDEMVFPKAFRMLDQIRAEGIAGDMSYKISSLKSQMRSAGKAAARTVLILGENEDKKGVVAFKDMETGEQQEISFVKAIEFLKSRKA